MIEKKQNIIYFLNEISKSFLFFIFLLLITNLEKSLSFFSIFKIATPSFISVIIYIFIKKLNLRPSYLSIFFVGFFNDIVFGGNLGCTSIFLLLIKFFSEGLFFENFNKNDQQDWISFTMIFLVSFCIVFFINIIVNLSIPDLSPIFYYVGTTLIIFPIVNLGFDFIFFITRLVKS
tara:strand:- start:810 stop:1337 length:528 start_codon:yes stop_codon:yes gene_type:complete